MARTRIRTCLVLSAVLAVPLGSPKEWQDLKFRKIKANSVGFSDSGLTIKVDQSASPLIYGFQQPLKIKSVKVKGELSNLLAFKTPHLQGQKGADDFTLRLGLVLSGKKRLGIVQKLIAPEWILKLYSLAPTGQGVDQILFFNAVQSKELLGRERIHPLSDLMSEKNVWLLDRTGEFELAQACSPREVLALWLSVDGDDTHSQFEVLLKKIELETEP